MGSQDTKDKLRKTALKLFVKDGIGNVSTAKITKNAGFSEATLFVHFQTKSNFIDDLYFTIKENQWKVFSTVPLDKSAEKCITNLFEKFVEYFIGHQDEASFLQQAYDKHYISKKTLEKSGALSKPLFDKFDEWKKEEQIKNIDNMLIACLFWSMTLNCAEHCRKAKKKKMPENLKHILWDALKR